MLKGTSCSTDAGKHLCLVQIPAKLHNNHFKMFVNENENNGFKMNISFDITKHIAIATSVQTMEN